VTSPEVEGPDTRSASSISKERFLLWFAAFSLTLILMAAIRWIFDHPYAIHADESSSTSIASRAGIWSGWLGESFSETATVLLRIVFSQFHFSLCWDSIQRRHDLSLSGSRV
jgi:hypothetical protein